MGWLTVKFAGSLFKCREEVEKMKKLEYGLEEILELELDIYKTRRDSKSSWTIFEPQYGDEITVNTESAEIEVREHGYFF